MYLVIPLREIALFDITLCWEKELIIEIPGRERGKEQLSFFKAVPHL